MAETSLENYRLHSERGDLGSQSALVLAFMENRAPRAFSRAEVSEALGMRLSSVCGRINELLKLSLLMEGEKRPCRVTGRTIRAVSAMPKGQLSLFQQKGPVGEVQPGLS